MRMFRKLILVGAMFGCLATTIPAQERDARDNHPGTRHVLLISVDGMHEVDLRLWIASHPHGTLAELSKHGTTYSQAFTTAPSDSFPGMLAQATGGTPYSTGVFYDDSYDRTFFAPSSNCAGMPGAETTYAENLDKSLSDVTGGGTLGDSLSQIDPKNLPMRLDHGHCVVVLPHQFVRVNTMFEVLRAHGLHTAWSDKHPAYEILAGPSGQGIEDLFTPEINSELGALLPGAPAGDDNTTSFKGVRIYDAIKVQSVINQIHGLSSTGHHLGYVPAILGMNFQAVSVGQKLASSGFGDPTGLVGGYLDALGTPGNALTQQLAFVDTSIGQMVQALKDVGAFDQTTIIISAKHGQSPINRALRRAIPDTYSTVLAGDGYGFNIADDASLIWLSPTLRTPATLEHAENDLNAASAVLGIHRILDRDDLVKSFRDPATDSRTPDFFVVSDHGVIYTGGSKLAEHGGVANDDRHVALLVSAPGLDSGTVSDQVFTTQIAPTILHLFNISAHELQAVQIEGTHKLPGVSSDVHHRSSP